MKRYLVVGKSKYVVLAVLQALQSHGKSQVYVLGDAETKSMRWSSLCREKLEVRFDGSGDVAFVGTVQRLASSIYPRTVLLPVDCDGIRLVNRVRDLLSPDIEIGPIPDPDTLEMFDDKWQFHQFCESQGLRVPTTHFVGSKDKLDFAALEQEFGLPFVVKPSNMAGSIGVQIVRSRQEFQAQIMDNAAYQHNSLIVQRFIDGHDIDLSLLADHGSLSAFAIQRVNGHQIEFLPNPYLEMVAAHISRLSAFNGVMHIDARIDSKTGTVYLIECNPRFWASLTACVVSGLNFVIESLAPSAAQSGVRRLISGSASCRHPMLQPSSWKDLAIDRGHLGRLWRAKALDPYSVAQFGKELSDSCMRLAQRKISLPGQRRAAQESAVKL